MYLSVKSYAIISLENTYFDLNIMKDNLILVSVIIPNYNHVDFLQERINSILLQTYSNIEIILLDDHSLDNSSEIIEKYRHHPKVSHIIYNNKNSGSPFMQWKKGIEIAKGEYIWIAESDDVCDSFFVEKLMDAILSQNTQVAFALSRYFDGKGNLWPTQQKLSKKDFPMSGKKIIKKYMSYTNSILNASGAIFKKNTAIEISSKIDYTKFKGVGDWFFWVVMCEQSRVSYIEEPLNYFRQHGNNTTSKLSISGDGLYELRWLFDYMRARHLISLKSYYYRRFWDIYYIYSDKTLSDERKKYKLAAWSASIIDYILYKFIYFLFHLSIRK